ncbi:enoyl-CoA hydratase [Flagellimonas myxillae]|uniref:enoyl-CoA hydratase n=1 Tax=Flagellimonas myxillae TaxID=2942214 RepID=UPI00201EEAF0|nr:enoyl-CoA hydratase [Muricauda myxillae]MCL6266561.1 enoyl-CoA hydratase [Muricauda myxillae]
MNNEKLHKTLDFIQEIGTIMYVGGILSHIVIGIIFSDADANTVYNVYVYKEKSAYILILPGLALKILSDMVLYFSFNEKPNWLKLKFVAVAFLTINAFFFLVPMMPELVALAKESIPAGRLSQEFIDNEHTEQFIGQLNVVPLLAELMLGSFKPKVGSRERENM